MKVRLVRHATLLVEVAGQLLLVDPMLDPAGARPAIEGTPAQRPNPLVDLPLGAEEVVRDVSAVLVSHLHADHLDDTAVELVRDRDLAVLGQPQDAATLRERGLRVVSSLDGVSVTLTDGRHGHGELAERLGPVSGLVLRAPGEPTLYIAGDTVWCEPVAGALREHRPDVVVVNAGGARFLQGEAITMTPEDVLAVADAAPQATVVAVHMEAINHCVVTRDDLRTAVGDRVVIPADGEQSVSPVIPAARSRAVSHRAPALGSHASIGHFDVHTTSNRPTDRAPQTQAKRRVPDRQNSLSAASARSSRMRTRATAALTWTDLGRWSPATCGAFSCSLAANLSAAPAV